MQVAYHALRCAEINLLVSAYVIAISISKQFTEWHSLCETLLRTQMSISDKLASWVCSHLMTPALSMMLAVLHLVFSQVMPAWACSALFWGRIFVLPPLSIWASWASWVRLRPRTTPILPQPALFLCHESHACVAKLVSRHAALHSM